MASDANAAIATATLIRRAFQRITSKASLIGWPGATSCESLRAIGKALASPFQATIVPETRDLRACFARVAGEVSADVGAATALPHPPATVSYSHDRVHDQVGPLA